MKQLAIPAEDLEDANCEFCGRSEAHAIGEDNGWTLVRCKACGHVFVSPRMTPERVTKYYAEHEWTAPSGQSADWHIWVERYRAVRLAEVFRAVSPPGSILEIGCGTGDILATLRAHGYQVQGIELDQVPARQAAQILGENSVSSEPIEHYHASNRFDAALMFSVLEHVSHPLAFMKEVNRVLKPGARVLISVPNLTYLLLRKRRGLTGEWGAPGHLHFFSTGSLERLLQLSGFRLLYQWWSSFPFIPESRRGLKARIAVTDSIYKSIWKLSGRRFYLADPLDVVAEKLA